MPGFSKEIKGKYVLDNDLIRSALTLVEDVLKYFDRLFINFPELYGKGGFSRIGCVKKIRSKVPFGTTEEKGEYQYPHGFFYPLLYGLIELIEYDKDTNLISWKINPADVNLKELNLSQYTELIPDYGYDPQKIGKKNAFYNEAENVYRKYLANENVRSKSVTQLF